MAAYTIQANTHHLYNIYTVLDKTIGHTAVSCGGKHLYIPLLNNPTCTMMYTQCIRLYNSPLIVRVCALTRKTELARYTRIHLVKTSALSLSFNCFQAAHDIASLISDPLQT